MKELRADDFRSFININDFITLFMFHLTIYCEQYF